jgi:phage tail-like protein
MANVVSVSRAEELARAAMQSPMRGLVPGLLSRYPIAERLPAALQEDDFCQRMMAALDGVLAPIFSTLDCWNSYLDPKLAPEDFLDWIGTWVGVHVDETWSLERRRQHIQDAVALYRLRGTITALATHIKLYCGVTPVIEESGGCTWSQTAMTPIPGSPHPYVTVKLSVDRDSSINRNTVSRIIDESRPAHIPFGLEIAIGGAAAAVEPTEIGGEAAADAPGAVALPGSDSINLAPPAPDMPEEYTGPSDIPPVAPPVAEEPGDQAADDETSDTETASDETEETTGESPATDGDEPAD